MVANNRKAALKRQKIEKYIRENSLTGERWEPIAGTQQGLYSDYYVSSKGRVLSARRNEPQLLKPQLTGSRYYYVKIYKKNRRIHRLEAAAFFTLPPPGCRFQIHHKDRDRLNNDLSNLEILSPEAHRAKHRELEAAAAAAAQEARKQ